MKINDILIGLVLILIVSCGEPKTAPSEQEPVASAEEAVHGTVPKDKIMQLYETADKVDVLFNDISVSLSQVTQQDVKGQISFLAPGEVPKKLNCSETAVIIYQSKGDIIADGRMYLRGDCHYVVFYEDNKPVYGAFLTDQAMEFYRKILAAGQSTISQ